MPSQPGTTRSAQERHQERLRKLQSDLSERLDALQRDMSTPLHKDFEEQATELENRDVVIALGKEARAELIEVERALERLESGRYGICLRCGEAISPDRLEAYPAASRCVPCASTRP